MICFVFQLTMSYPSYYHNNPSNATTQYTAAQPAGQSGGSDGYGDTLWMGGLEPYMDSNFIDQAFKEALQRSDHIIKKVTLPFDKVRRKITASHLRLYEASMLFDDITVQLIFIGRPTS